MLFLVAPALVCMACFTRSLSCPLRSHAHTTLFHHYRKQQMFYYLQTASIQMPNALTHEINLLDNDNVCDGAWLAK